MGERLDFLVRGMARMHSVISAWWNGFTTPPPAADQRDTYTDQWLQR